MIKVILNTVQIERWIRHGRGKKWWNAGEYGKKRVWEQRRSEGSGEWGVEKFSVYIQLDCGKDSAGNRLRKFSWIDDTTSPQFGLFSEWQTESWAEMAKNLISKEKRQMAYKELQLGRHLISPQGSSGSSKTWQCYHWMLGVNNP